MNKLVVLAKNLETNFVKRLREELSGEVVFFNPWSDFILPEGDRYLVRTTGVYGSDLDLLFLKSLSQKYIINPLPTLQRFRSKLTQYAWLDEQNFPALHWLAVKGTDLLTIEKFFRLYPEVVVKPCVGQGGWGVEALNWERFRSWQKKKGSDQDYLLQPLIRGARELRYFFIKDTWSCVLERSAPSGVAANFRKQGKAQLSELPEEHRPILERLIRDSGAIYGAIDLLLDDRHLYVLELNAVPGIEQLEQVSGENVMARLTAKFFCQDS